MAAWCAMHDIRSIDASQSMHVEKPIALGLENFARRPGSQTASRRFV
jgi:hypothetical protein